jgi:arsenate reductase-like glutaredoxin family protein
MSAPPARTPVQVFGRDDSQPTRAALRFFKERRVAVAYVNLRVRPIAPGELRRFVERLGAAACADTDGKAWRDAGLGYLRMDDAELAGRLLADQRLLRLPLCRDGAAVTAGPAEATWRGWVTSGGSGASAAAGGQAAARGAGAGHTDRGSRGGTS